jgi:hypothetical protein
MYAIVGNPDDHAHRWWVKSIGTWLAVGLEMPSFQDLNQLMPSSTDLNQLNINYYIL